MAQITRFQTSPMMSQCVVHNGVVYLAGQIAWDTRSDDIKSQTREVLGRIDRLLSEAETNKSHLLTASIWLADMSDFAEMNEVWVAWIDPDHPPARATVQAALAFPELRVEVQVTAACL